MQTVTEALGRQSQTQRGRDHINQLVRTARAVLQHHNAAIHITIHNTQRLHLCLQTNITISDMWPKADW